MKLSIRELYEKLQEMDEQGLLDSHDGEIVVAYQPHYPLSAVATGFGYIDRGDRIELVIGCGADGGNYADSLQVMAFVASGDELEHEPEGEEEW